MDLIRVIRRLFSKPNAPQQYEYVKVSAVEPALNAGPLPGHPATDAMVNLRGPVAEGPAVEIAFSAQGDLEAYVRELALPKEAIERWISAGVLLPEETRVATQMIRIMCKNKDFPTS
jgi:hypothetical protein